MVYTEIWWVEYTSVLVKSGNVLFKERRSWCVEFVLLANRSNSELSEQMEMGSQTLQLTE